MLRYTLNVVEVADYIDRVGFASEELVLEREVAVVISGAKIFIQFLIITCLLVTFPF